MKEKQLIVLLILAAVSVITFFWWQYNQRGAKSRGTTKYGGPNAASRASDLKILSPQEEKIRERAKKLVAKGRVRQAAQMLEQIGLHRDAISALESAKMIDDAARILLRMQNPARAGVIYSRNGYWKEASQCFIQAGNLTDAANCLREAGNHFEAADLFLKENLFDNAAECFQLSGRWLEASRAWIKAGKNDHSLRCWKEIGQNISLLKGQTPTSEEVQLLFQLAKTGEQNPGIITLISSSPKVTHMILDAMSDGNKTLAAQILKAAQSHIAATLVSEINIQSPEAKVLAEIFNESGEYRYSGMLYEQSSDFEAAAKAFDKAGENERANYCRERLGVPKTNKPPKSVSETFPPSMPPPAPQFTSASPKGNFFIETGSLKIDTVSDESSQIMTSWLFEQIGTQELQSIIRSFKVINIAPEGKVISGSASSFLIYVVRGELSSDQGTKIAGQWLAPDLALSGSGPVTWQATSDCRTLVMTAPDFDLIIGSNAALMRKVFTNLTRHQVASHDNTPKSRAV